VSADQAITPTVTVAPLGLDAEELRAIEAIAEAAFPQDDHAVQPAEEVTRPWARIWVARLRAEPIGFLVAWHVADELHVHSVATSPSRRRTGAGLALMQEALAYARAQAVRIVLLEVRRSNYAATSLYRKLGFSVLNVRKGYYARGDEDGLELILTLDPATGAILPRTDELRVDGLT
jgi:ribosomal-protein-alanine N-acetyltransferase